MDRNKLLKLVSVFKTVGSIDNFVRYNPFVGARVKKALAAYEKGEFQLYQEKLLQEIYAAARDTEYGSSFQADWPILQKDTLKDNPARFVNPKARMKVPASTGGTTGAPIELWRSLECIMAKQMFLNSMLAKHGIAMNTSKIAVLRGDNIKSPSDLAPPFGVESHGGNKLTLSPYHLSADTIHWYHEALQTFSPSILWVYPNAAVSLTHLLQSAGLKLSIPVILASSEAMSGLVHTALENFYSASVINYYGQAERACLAYSTRPNEFYFNPAYGKVEFEKGLDNGEKVIQIIGTGFWNKAMPLIRYNTGDLLYVPEGTTDADLQLIAMGKKSFPGVSGRVGEYLLTREGARSVGLNQIPREVKNIAQIQLIQVDYDNLYVDVMTLPGFSDADSKQLLAQAKAKAPAGMQITVRVVESFEKTARGKTPYVIRKIS